jgi:hypothetical protein
MAKIIKQRSVENPESTKETGRHPLRKRVRPQDVKERIAKKHADGDYPIDESETVPPNLTRKEKHDPIKGVREAKKNPNETRGRPCMLDSLPLDRIYDLVRKGVPLRQLAPILGVYQSRFDDWLSKGKAEYGEPYNSFYLNIQKAYGEFIDSHVTIVGEAGQKDWKASAWLLERRAKKDFGQATTIGGDSDNPIEIKTSNEAPKTPSEITGEVLDILKAAGALEREEDNAEDAISESSGD